VEYVHEGPFQARHSDLQTRAISLDYVEGDSDLGRQSPGKANSLELVGPEADGPRRCGGKIDEVLVDRIGLAVDSMAVW
jgi:hypothetical protein